MRRPMTELITPFRRVLAPPAPDGRRAETWTPIGPGPVRAAVELGSTEAVDAARGATLETTATFTVWGVGIEPGDRIAWRGWTWAVRGVAPATLNPMTSAITAVRTEG